MSKEEQLEDQISRVVFAHHRDAEKTAKLVEILLDGVAYAIAMGSRGDSKMMNDALEGLSQQLFESAAEYANIIQEIRK